MEYNEQDVLNMIGYIITGVVCFIIGFIVAARNKDNISIGFGNKTTTIYKDDKESIKNY